MTVVLSSFARVAAKRLALRSGIPAASTVTSRTFAIGDTYSKKEKVEEDRYIREQEKKFFEKKRAELDAVKHEEELKEYEEIIAPAMAVAENLLSKTGDEVSHEGLEAIVRWKLGK